jgi:hypothetical protein
MTALTGIFKTWDLAPCSSGNTSGSRQQLALQQLALAATIGQSLIGAGVADGVQRAGNVILDAQKTIVTENLTDKTAIDNMIADLERAQGIDIPTELRRQLLDLMVRLATAEIDWSTFSAGWEIERNEGNTRITMTGDGIAIRNARLTATARAAEAMTQTAEAGAAMTATAQAAIDLTATADAAAALTATAAAQPTITPTPEPFTTSGIIVEMRPGELVVEQEGSSTSSPFRVRAGASITRDGSPVELTKLHKGDTVRMTVDAGTLEVITVAAEPAPGSSLAPILAGGALALVGLAAVALIVLKRRRQLEPFVITLKPA